MPYIIYYYLWIKKKGKSDILTNFCDGLYNISTPMYSNIQSWIQTNLTC